MLVNHFPKNVYLFVHNECTKSRAYRERDVAPPPYKSMKLKKDVFYTNDYTSCPYPGFD